MLVNSLAHVVNCQKRCLYACQSLHLHPGFALCLYRTVRMDPAVFLIQFKINCTLLDWQRMAHGNQRRSLLHPHDPCYSGYAENIAFFYISSRNRRHDFCSHGNIACGYSCPKSGLLTGNIHHHCISFMIKMAEFLPHQYNLLILPLV